MIYGCCTANVHATAGPLLLTWIYKRTVHGCPPSEWKLYAEQQQIIEDRDLLGSGWDYYTDLL